MATPLDPVGRPHSGRVESGDLETPSALALIHLLPLALLLAPARRSVEDTPAATLLPLLTKNSPLLRASIRLSLREEWRAVTLLLCVVL